MFDIEDRNQLLVKELIKLLLVYCVLQASLSMKIFFTVNQISLPGYIKAFVPLSQLFLFFQDIKICSSGSSEILPCQK